MESEHSISQLSTTGVDEILDAMQVQLPVNGTSAATATGAATAAMATLTPALSGDKLDSALLRAYATDEGNAQVVHRLYGHLFLRCAALGWLHWTGTHWSTDGAEERLDSAIVDTLIRRHSAAATRSMDALAKETAATAKRVRDTKYLFKRLVTVPNDTFDNSPDLLNCANGVVDLRTGRLTPHSHEQRFTYCIPTEYQPDADSSLWTQFLTGSVAGGAETVDYLQQALGYTLTGHTSEECLFYVFGPTRSGKGTFSESLLSMLGAPMARAADFKMFTSDSAHADYQNFSLAVLYNARMVVCGDSDKYTTLNAGRVKSVTGGDYLQVAFKYRDAFTVRPQFKLWLLSNHEVRADVDDSALWVRVRVIEFPHSHEGNEDRSIKARMRQPDTLRGILAWCVAGAVKWYQTGARGLRIPDAVAAATRTHRETQDYVQQWLDECTESGQHHWTANSTLYTSYSDWCKANGVSALGQRVLSMSLARKGYAVGERGYEKGQRHRGVRGLTVA